MVAVSEATGTGSAVKVGTPHVSSFVTLACLSTICVLASSVRATLFKERKDD